MADVTAEDVRNQVGAGADRDPDCRAALDLARALLDEHLADVDRDDPVPAAVYRRALILAAAEAFNQAEAPNGVLNQQYDDGTSAPIRIGADPLRPAYPLVQRWVLPVVG